MVPTPAECSKPRARLSARGRVERGRASERLWHLADALKHFGPGRYVICCRESSWKQQRRRNLMDQRAELLQVCNEIGASVVGEIMHVGSGFDPSWLRPAARMAKESGALILAESTDRLIRHPDYHSKTNPDAQASERELCELAFWLDDVVAVTVLHPDATPYEVRSYQRRRGQRAKGNFGGRPPKKVAGYKRRRREALEPRAIRLRQRGLSLAEIAVALECARTTIQRWVAGVPFFDDHAGVRAASTCIKAEEAQCP
jgi:hypothetical protein